jgi:branched-chain amino acid transport system substrate-binding protein
MGWQPNYQSEAQIYAKYILKKKPNAKIACSIRTTITARTT